MSISAKQLIFLGYLFPLVSLLALVGYELLIGGIKAFPFILYLGLLVYQAVTALVYPGKKVDTALLAIGFCILGPIYFLIQQVLESLFNVGDNVLVSLAIIGLLSGSIFLLLALRQWYKEKAEKLPAHSAITKSKASRRRPSDELKYPYGIYKHARVIDVETAEGIPYLDHLRQTVDSDGKAKLFMRKAARFLRQSDNAGGEPSQSWIGGLPQLDVSQAWPKREDGAPMHHLLSLDCNMLSEQTDLPFPKSGRLAFFAGHIPIDDGIAVLHCHGEETAPVPNDLLPWDMDLSRGVPDEIKLEIPVTLRQEFIFPKEVLTVSQILDYSAPIEGELEAYENWPDKTQLLLETPEAFKSRFIDFFPVQPTRIERAQDRLLKQYHPLDNDSYDHIREKVSSPALQDLSIIGLRKLIALIASALLSDYPYTYQSDFSEDQLRNIRMRNKALRDCFALANRVAHIDEEDEAANDVVRQNICQLVDGPLPEPQYRYDWNQMFHAAAYHELTMASIHDRLDGQDEKFALYLADTAWAKPHSKIQVGGFGVDMHDDASSRRDPIMLLQIEEFVSAGILQYWISYEDLKQGRFDKAYCTNDCT